MPENIEFQSEGVTLRGWLFLPEGRGPHPAVAMAPGFNSVKEVFLSYQFPRVFAEAGLAVALWDHPTCGDSDGEPRRELDPLRQQRGYRDAITYLAGRPEVDPERIGIWGTSYSGGHVLAVAAVDRRVRCVVSQAMTVSGRDNMVARHTPARLAELQAAFAADRLGRMRGEAPVVVPAFAQDSDTMRQQELLPAEHRVNWRNEITLRSWELYNEYEPAAFIDRICPTPLLMIVPTADSMTPSVDALAAYQRALEPKALLTVPGGHYSVYIDQFEATSAAARDWLVTHLGPTGP